MSVAGIQIEEWIAENSERTNGNRLKEQRVDIQASLKTKNDSFLGYVSGNFDRLDTCDNYFHLLCGGNDSITTVNAINSKGMPELFPGALVIAYDNNGNLFSLNCGANAKGNLGKVLYMPQDSFVWEDLDIGYAEFIKWVICATDQELLDGDWKCGEPLRNARSCIDYVIGKAAAYNMLLRQKG